MLSIARGLCGTLAGICIMTVVTIAPCSVNAFASESVLGHDDGIIATDDADSQVGSPYIVKVGYKPELGRTYSKIISNKTDWDRFLKSMQDTIYDGQSGSYAVMPPGFRDYPESYFALGKVAVAYAELGSGSTSPSIVGITEEGPTLRIQYDEGFRPGYLYTCDMSGFVAVVELAPSSAVTTVIMNRIPWQQLPDAEEAAETVSAESSSGVSAQDAYDDSPEAVGDTPTPSDGSSTKPSKIKTAVNVKKSLSMSTKSSISLGAYPCDTKGRKLASSSYTTAQRKGGTMTYSSKNTKVATVDKNGKVTAKLPGKAVIVTRYSGNVTFAPSSSQTTITVKKRTQGFSKCSAHNVTVKYTQVKRTSAVAVPITPPKTIYATGGVTYKKTSGRSSIKVNAKTGKVSVGKGTPKGTYLVSVKVSSKADSYCAAYSQTVKFKVAVK